ncbi:MAG: serine hydroxymethyltransferase [Oscillospiraceae bacterium]|nr:serine hydroxymethyltransferase [Oscillospiraceae bacterium]
MELVRQADPEIGEAMLAELARQRDGLELIASENFVSEAVMAAMGSVLTNKYAEGLPGKRYYGGCGCVDVAEELARKRACELFGAEHANVQPHSGAQANNAVYFAFCKPGDSVLAMNLSHGGHLTHGSPVNISGCYYNIIPYGVDEETGYVNMDDVRRLALEHRPRMILAGYSAYPRILDFKAFADIAKESGAILFVDMAHFAGLVAAKLHPSPVPYADVVTATTHKTLRGPRGGLVLCKAEHQKAVDRGVFPGTQGGPLMHVIAAKAVAFGEAMKPEFADYGRRVLDNAQALSKGLTAKGFKLITGGTDNHLMVADLRPFGVTGKRMQERLDDVHLTVSRSSFPGDPEKPYYTSGIRIGTPAVTTRGLNTDDMNVLADLLYMAAADFDAKAAYIRETVAGICGKYPLYN